MTSSIAVTSAAQAQSAWVARFDGPILRREITFGSPLIRHQHKRSFEHVGRNVHFVSVFGRVLLGEEKILAAEDAVYKRIEEITTAIERKAAAVLVVLKDSNISPDGIAVYNKPQTIMLDIVVPAQSKFVRLLEKADTYAQGFFTLWLEGEIDDKEKSRLELELKKLLRSIPATTRKMRLFIQAKLEASENEEAKKEARVMVSDAKDDDDDAGDDAALPLDAEGKPIPLKLGAKDTVRAKTKNKAAAPASVPGPDAVQASAPEAAAA